MDVNPLFQWVNKVGDPELTSLSSLDPSCLLFVSFFCCHNYYKAQGLGLASLGSPPGLLGDSSLSRGALQGGIWYKEFFASWDVGHTCCSEFPFGCCYYPADYSFSFVGAALLWLRDPTPSPPVMGRCHWTLLMALQQLDSSFLCPCPYALPFCGSHTALSTWA